MPGELGHAHSGHRRRMKDRYRIMGLDGFAPHEALELLLFYAIPQRDVNPLAHRLINRFGSLNGVLAAKREELMEIAGIGEKTVRFISEIGRACELYASYCENKLGVSKLSESKTYINRLFNVGDCEQTWVVCMDKTGRLLGSAIVGYDGWADESVINRTLKVVIKNHASTMFMLERRSPEKMETTVKDLDAIENIAKAMIKIGVLTIDMIMASDAEVISMRQNRLYNPEIKTRESDVNLSRLYSQWLD